MPKNKEPKLVGIWIFQVTPNRDLIKYGIDGDDKFPHKSEREAKEEAGYHYRQSIVSAIFLAYVFDNGQIRHEEFDPNGTRSHRSP